MTHGGTRVGSGRKKGALGKKTREIAEQAAKEGITPLEVLISTMRMAWDKKEEDNAYLATAVSCAEKAAPYMHPRIATVNVGGQPDNPLVGKLIVQWGKRDG